MSAAVVQSVLLERGDGLDWARSILQRHMDGHRFTLTVLRFAREALGQQAQKGL